MNRDFHIHGVPNDPPDLEKLVAALLALATEMTAETATTSKRPSMPRKESDG